jgi:hypothetical protein
MACVFSAGWVRSLTTSDLLDINLSPRFGICGVFESAGGIVLLRREAPIGHNTTWQTGTDNIPRGVEWMADEPYSSYAWRFRCGELSVGQFRKSVFAAKEDPEFLFYFMTFPYWSIVIPLTMISAWCLLSKPRTIPPG